MLGKVNGAATGETRRAAARAGMARGAEPTTSVLAPDLHVIGMVESRGHVEIYGTVEGQISGRTVAVGKGAFINGSINAQSAWIGGLIDGPITAYSVVMSETARVVGSIFHHELRMDPGAVHKGRKPWRLNPLDGG